MLVRSTFFVKIRCHPCRFDRMTRIWDPACLLFLISAQALAWLTKRMTRKRLVAAGHIMRTLGPWIRGTQLQSCGVNIVQLMNEE
uniref:Uncharacterized protein n=1 Tax=Zea mays TaxID=4577 RepID=B7ZZB3_MAIZE|nr:unknown [Zea mays]